MDNGDIDYAILNIFEELLKNRYRNLDANSNYFTNELIHTPLFQALLDLNIIWKSKYYDILQVEHPLYF